MNDDLFKISWPVSRLGEALEALARRSKLSSYPAEVPTLPEGLREADDETLSVWIRAVAGGMSLEAESVFCSYGELEQVVKSAGPALLRLPASGGPRFLAVVGRGWRTVSLLDPSMRVHNVEPSLICSVLRRAIEAPLEAELEMLVEGVGLPRKKRIKARRAILRERLSPVMLGGFWLLRIPPGASFVRQLRQARAVRYICGLAGAHVLQYILWLLSWWVIGRGVLSGQLDYAWLTAWGLLLLTMIPFRVVTPWLQGVLAIRIGELLKQRLFCGALRLDPAQIRHQGAGQLLGRIFETEAVESLALSAGFVGLLAVIELGMAAVVLGMGSGGWPHSVLLLAWVGITLLVGWTYYKRRLEWTDERIEITNDLVERMVGHRTRLAQEPRECWHETEDYSLERYCVAGQKMDRNAVALMAIMTRGWMVIGMLGLAHALIWGSSSIGTLAVGVGGMLLSFAPLRRLTAGITQLTDAAIAWKEVAPLFNAAAPKVTDKPIPMFAQDPGAHSLNEGATLMEARDLVFRYPRRNEPVIKGCDLRIAVGDRLLLEGPSGGGKSTFASLIVGLLQPDSGLLLMRGFDKQTLGDENWRRLVVSAPQFHENHVMTETFAFNLLMGRRWPASLADLEECESVCRELGLGELLDRMPAGMLQMVGDTGWQLSHGERSRLYIARALLQHADLIVLDESFAALDPENLRRALICVLKRAPTLLVIAHP